MCLASTLSVVAARAGEFDASGTFQPDEGAELVLSFEGDKVAGVSCSGSCEARLSKAELALHGEQYLSLSANQSAFELALGLVSDATYEARAWVRHGRVWVRVVADYANRPSETTYLFPTGRVTSDGWVELKSAAFSLAASTATRIGLRINGGSAELDAVEIRRVGGVAPLRACLGAGDPVCGSEAECIGEYCREGNRFVPPLPDAEYRDSVTAYLRARLTQFFGGKRSRAENLPHALQELEAMKQATSAWQYWNAHSKAIRALDDWHTGSSSGISGVGSTRRLGVCFIEGTADLTQTQAPSDAELADVLVSHVGPDATMGLVPGDRLVAVDGKHPLRWARALRDHNWRHHVATDPEVQTELAESMRSLIVDFAKELSVVRCDPTTLTCGKVETIPVGALPTSGAIPRCDNRPSYHLLEPPESSPGALESLHQLPFIPWLDLVTDSQPGESIYGMTFDTVYGTSQGLTPFFLDANKTFKSKARGVILDHRAGNGGTKDAATAISQLVRPAEMIAVGPTFVTVAGDDGASSAAEGLQRFKELSAQYGQPFTVGASIHDPALPVAFVIHRDGSASDLLALALKGAPNVRVFGHHKTAGAFSSFYEYSYWSRYEYQVASGDCLLADGSALIGHGVTPDEIVQHSQTSLLRHEDAPYDAALSWVRSRLK